jgi:hypothetical protein
MKKKKIRTLVKGPERSDRAALKMLDTERKIASDRNKRKAKLQQSALERLSQKIGLYLK